MFEFRAVRMGPYHQIPNGVKIALFKDNRYEAVASYTPEEYEELQDAIRYSPQALIEELLRKERLAAGNRQRIEREIGELRTRIDNLINELSNY